LARIGEVTDSGKLDIVGLNGRNVVSTAITELKEAWQRPLRW